MTKLFNFLAIFVILSSVLWMAACGPKVFEPTQTNDCRINASHDAMDVLKGCPKGISVEIKK